MKHISHKLLVLALLVPLGACESGDELVGAPNDTTAQVVVATDDTTAQVAALYQNGGDSILLETRRIVTELDEADGVRSEWYLQVDASAPEFEVEVTAVDPQRGIRLVARGDRLSVESEGASAADKDRVMALFGEAMLTLAASDAPIPLAERQVLDDLGDAAATHPGFLDPADYPWDRVDKGCTATNGAPTLSGNSVIATSTVTCETTGERKFSMCIRARKLRSLVGTIWHGLWSFPKVKGDFEVGCQETKSTEATTSVNADLLCGSYSGNHVYEPHLRSVEYFNWILPDEWHTLTKGPTATLLCGES